MKQVSKLNELECLLDKLVGKEVVPNTKEQYVNCEVRIKKAQIYDGKVKIELEGYLGNLKISNYWANADLFKEVV